MDISSEPRTKISPVTELRRTLTLRDLILLIIGTVIGSGIFLVPGRILHEVHGRLDLAILVWLAGGVLSLLGALTYGELSATNHAAGGLYVYIRDSFGALPAFLYGWTLFLVIGSGSVATLAVAFGDYMGQLASLSTASSKTVAVLMIAVVAVVNISGTRRSANVQNWSTAAKVCLLLVLSLVLLFLGTQFKAPAGSVAANPHPLWQGLVLAMVSVLWAYEGWQYCTFSAGETKRPQADFPRAFLIGLLALLAIYLLANVGYIAALGTSAAGQSNRIAADAIAAVVGPRSAQIATVAILLSILSAANGLTLTGTRVYYAMANDGLFFRKLAEIHPRFGTPAVAIAAGSMWAILLALSGTFQQLLTYVVFAGWYGNLRRVTARAIRDPRTSHP